MAIDTRNRRASTLHHSNPYVVLSPNPDGSLASVEDRQHLGMIYAGISTSRTFSAAWVPTISNVIIYMQD
jgi:hypothetical protein